MSRHRRRWWRKTQVKCYRRRFYRPGDYWPIDHPGVTLLVRRATAHAWMLANPILRDGEVGYVTDTNSCRIGDGKTRWLKLKEMT